MDILLTDPATKKLYKILRWGAVSSGDTILTHKGVVAAIIERLFVLQEVSSFNAFILQEVSRSNTPQ